MNSFILVSLLFCIAICGNPRPQDLVGGLNPDFGDFKPATPIVTNSEGDPTVSNYPRTFHFLTIIYRLWCI